MFNNIWKKKNTNMVGIDIGSNSVKAVLLGQIDSGYILKAIAIEKIPKGVVVDSEIQDIEAVANIIAKIRKKIHKSVTECAVAVSGKTVITKVIYMDAGYTDEEISNQIDIEADSLIPFPLDEVSIDFEKLNINENDKSKVNVLLSAGRTESVAARVAALEGGNFNTKVVDVESYAVSRLFDLCLPKLPNDALEKTVAIIDIGASTTLFSVTHKGEHTYSRDQLFGGEQYTRAIVNHYNQTFEDAEQLKVTNNLPKNHKLEVLASFHMMLIQQVRRFIQMYLTSSGNDKVDYIVLSGGTSMIQDIDAVLSNDLGLPCIVINPFTYMSIDKEVNKEVLAEVAPQLSVATGLALRSFSPWHI